MTTLLLLMHVKYANIFTVVDTGELIIFIVVPICAAFVLMIMVGPVLFLYIRQRFHRRAKIVDISQVAKSVGAPEAKPSNQFVVRRNDDKEFFYINYPQNPLLVNEGNSDSNEMCTYT